MAAGIAALGAGLATLLVVILWSALHGLTQRLATAEPTAAAAPVDSSAPHDPASASSAALLAHQPAQVEKPLSPRTYRFQPAQEYVYEYSYNAGPAASWAKGRLIYSLRRSHAHVLELEYRADWGPAGNQQTRGELRTTDQGTWLSSPAADEAPLVVRVGGLAIEPLSTDDASQWETTRQGTVQQMGGAPLLPKLFEMAGEPTTAGLYQERRKYTVVRETPELIAIDCDYALYASSTARTPLIVGIGSCEFDKPQGLMRKGAMNFTLAGNRVVQHRFELQQVVTVATPQIPVR